MKLLVIEDDVEIATSVGKVLRAEDYLVDVEYDGPAGLEAALAGTHSLVILDIMLPGIDGWTVCRQLRRAHYASPILMLTAKDSIEDRVRGLEEGADDYLVKPFDSRELLARVRALLRRDQTQKTGVITVADLEVDTKARVASRAGVALKLTPREYTLLEALARNAGRTLTREVILDRVWDSEENTENTVNFHVTSLRKKVDAAHEVKLIHTVHGFGYSLRSSEGG